MLETLDTVWQAHEFALYSATVLHVATMTPGKSVLLHEPDIVKRLVQILRVQDGQKILLFDKDHHVTLLVEQVLGKKEIKARVLMVEKNKLLLPQIHWFLPLLERDAFEEALASITILGATSIQPVITRKVHRTAFLPKERDRLERVMIAACEQSKQFMLPTIKPIIRIELLAPPTSASSHTFFFDPAGMPSLEMIKKLQAEPNKDIICMVGPEGDLTPEEKTLVKNLNFFFCALTPTILRSKDAVFLATGLLRSIT